MKVDPVETATRNYDEVRDPEEQSGGDLFPKTPEEHARLLGWCLDEFRAADDVREPLATRWKRYYKLYRSWIVRRTGDWRSKVFIPIAFYVIEAIAPRMVAQLPKFIVTPVGPEDEEPAETMEQLLSWSADRSRLYLELVKIYRSALKYGTGIAKVRHERKTIKVREQVPQTMPQTMDQQTPLMDEMGAPMLDLDGAPMMDTQPMQIGEVPTGSMKWERTEKVVYDGPCAEAVDIFNFWPAPEATSIEDARYVIQRTFRDDKYVKRMLDEGVYKMPPGMEFDDFFSGETNDIDKLRTETHNAGDDPTRTLAELLEFWTDDTVMTVLNRRAVVRVQENPFDHGEKPFIRVVDYFQEHEFWGIGEIEPLEGMQDVMNALWNQRIDNVRLVLNRMMAFDPDNIHDLRDLQIRPGGTIRVKTHDIPAGQVLQPIEIPDVTGSSYTEASEIERMTEKVSGVSAYTTGTDSPTQNDTATGISLITEAGNTRFSLKVRMAELTGLVPLARQFGSILQQFMPDEMIVRVVGEDGELDWKEVTADGLQGGFDFDIEAESSTVTESVRKEQAMSLMQTFAQIIDPATGQPVLNLQALAKDVLDAFGKVNKDRYAPAPPPPPPMGMEQGMGGMPGEDPNQDPNAIMAAMAAGGMPQ